MPSPCYPHALSPRSLADISGADKQWNVALQPVEACPARADPVTGQMKHHHRVHWLLLISAEIGAKRPCCTVAAQLLMRPLRRRYAVAGIGGGIACHAGSDGSQ